MAEEWEEFDFEPRSELSTVRHIAHVPTARRIIEDGKIKAGLVYDKSLLRQSRLSVSWVSANEWFQGSIYGTVEFQFIWSDLVKDQKIYWVEVMRGYRPPAYRFLLSKTSIDAPLIKSYDPSTAKGPLKLLGDKWHWNENLTSEFMITDDLLLSNASGLNFVLHNKEKCQPKRHVCLDMKRQPSREHTGGKILAYIVGHDLHILDKHLKPSEPPAGANLLLELAYQGLKGGLLDSGFGGPLDFDASCDKATSGALALYGTDQFDRAASLLSLIMKKEHFENALQRLIRSHFDTPAWKPDPNVF